MIPAFFTDNNEDRIAFVEFIQNNRLILENLLEKQTEKMAIEGKKFKHPDNQKQKLTDTLAFSEKNRKFTQVKTTFNYFVDMNLGDDPVRGELLYDLDSDEIHNDGYMENPERRKQIREFEIWLNTEDVKKSLAIGKLNKSIKKHHIANLKENMADLSVRPFGILSKTDPGGLAYQKALGKWERNTMELHDKPNRGGKKRTNFKKTKKNKTKKYRKTRRLK